MRPLYIFDLDGTLSLADHRRHLVETPVCHYCDGKGATGEIGLYGWDECASCGGSGKDPRFEPDWDAFYAACGDDLPNMPVIRTLSQLAQISDIWIFSGRRESTRDVTRAWLEKYMPVSRFIPDHAIVMRPNGDSTPDDVLKQSWLDNMLDIDRQRLVATFDDRTRVVNMWRRNGISCFQVAEGNF